MNACLAIYTMLGNRLFLQRKLDVWTKNKELAFLFQLVGSPNLSHRGGGLIGWMHAVNTGLVVGIRPTRSVRRL